MFKLVTLFSLFISSFAADSFITSKEYGEMLYKNPRGVGCDRCHGTKGEGGVIGTAKSKKGVTKELYAPSIKYFNERMLENGVDKHSNFVPSYFLTKEEYKSVAEFLKDE